MGVGIDVLVFVVDGWPAEVGNCGAEPELGSWLFEAAVGWVVGVADSWRFEMAVGWVPVAVAAVVE